MQHFQFHLWVVGYFFFVVGDYVVVTNSEPRGIKVKFRFFFRSNTDAHFEFLVEIRHQQIELKDIVQNGNHIVETDVDQVLDILHIHRALESVA